MRKNLRHSVLGAVGVIAVYWAIEFGYTGQVGSIRRFAGMDNG